MSKIGLCGSMSVGKTTLAKALGELPQFKNYKIFTERSKYLKDQGIPLNTDSTIYGQHIFLNERIKELKSDVNIITDRTIIDVCAFTNLARSIDTSEKIWFERYAINWLCYYDYIFYIPCTEDLPIEDNKIRETNSDYRKEIDKEINYLVRYYSDGKLFYCISGTTEERINQIMGIIKI